jgi:hypothetical protein
MKVVFLVILAALSSAYAAPITFQFTGMVTQVPVDDIFGDIAFDDPFQGSFTFESAAPDLIPGDDTTGSYTSIGAPYGMTVTIAGHNFSTFGSLNIGISNFALADIYTVIAATAGGDLTLELFLFDGSTTALASDGLPLSPPTLTNFGLADFHLHQIVDFSEVQVDGQLSSLRCVSGCRVAPPTGVPEPGTGLLLCAGAAVFALLGLKSFFNIH